MLLQSITIKQVNTNYAGEQKLIQLRWLIHVNTNYYKLIQSNTSYYMLLQTNTG